jgi:cytochrome c peroxidase
MITRLIPGIRSSRIVSCLGALVMAVACGEPLPDSDSVATDPAAASSEVSEWTESVLALLTSLSLSRLGSAPASPSNRVAEDVRAARLGQHLFFDKGLSRNGEIACATCHQPALLFTDGRPTSRGISATARNAPTLIAVAHSTWMYWDGRRDSLWAQALAPLETAAEMGSTRVAVVRRVTTDQKTRDAYRSIFGEAPPLNDLRRFPERAGPFGDVNERAAWARMSSLDRSAIDRAFADIGKAIGAYERQLQPGPSRFDRYVEGLLGPDPEAAPALLSEQEIQGLRLFVDADRSLCLRCHNGPLFTNQSFHDVGTGFGVGGIPEFGRYLGIQAVLIDPFNCLGAYSDAPPKRCGELRFLNKRHIDAETGKFKTPTLRGLARTAPYLHDGRLASLEAVIEHYRHPDESIGDNPEITPLEISDEEAAALVAFLAALDGPAATPTDWLDAPTMDWAALSEKDPSRQVVDNDPPAPSVEERDLPETARSTLSMQGLFTVHIWPEDKTIPLRALHAWIVRIEDAHGTRVEPTRLILDGGMPQHRHGFNTEPQVTQRMANGDFRIDGIKFHMHGAWQLRLQVTTKTAMDVAEFEIQVGP